MTSSPRFVYTLASRAQLPVYAFLSIQSLLQYVDPEDVTVFFTPPRETDHVNAIQGLDVDLRLVETRTEPFQAFDSPQHYGEKLWLCTLPNETVVFLDCDTFILGDITNVIDGEFQFKARPGTSSIRQPEWRELFHRFNQPYMDWMPNTGFMIFKDGIHHELEEDWARFLSTNLEYHHDTNHKEQYALALTLGSYDSEQMTMKEHTMLWNDEYPADGVVYHVGKALDPDIQIPDTFKGHVRLGLQKLIKSDG